MLVNWFNGVIDSLRDAFLYIAPDRNLSLKLSNTKRDGLIILMFPEVSFELFSFGEIYFSHPVEIVNFNNVQFTQQRRGSRVIRDGFVAIKVYLFEFQVVVRLEKQNNKHSSIKKNEIRSNDSHRTLLLTSISITA